MSIYLYKDNATELYVFKYKGFVFNPKPGSMMLIERESDGFVNLQAVYDNKAFRQNTNGHILNDFVDPELILDDTGTAYGAAASDILAALSDFFVDAPASTGATDLLGGIAHDAAAPTPGVSGKYYFTSAGVVSWISGTPTVSIGDEVIVVYNDPDYTYTYLPVGTQLDLKFDKANLESTRSQSTTKAPTSKLIDDEFNKVISKTAVEANRTAQLFNKDDYRANTLMSSAGNLTTVGATGYGTSADIQIEAGNTHITFSGWSAQLHRIAFFNSSNVLVGSVIAVSQSTAYTAEIPVGASYFRVMFATATHEAIAPNFKLNYGQTAINYTNYYSSLKSVMGYPVGDVDGINVRVGVLEGEMDSSEKQISLTKENTQWHLYDHPEIITTTDLTVVEVGWLVDVYKHSLGVFEGSIYLRRIRNKTGLNGGLAQFFDAESGGNLVAQWVDSNATEIRTGIQTIEVKEYASSGIRFYMVVNWNAISASVSDVTNVLGFDLTKVKVSQNNDVFNRIRTLEAVDKFDTYFHFNVFGDILPNTFKTKLFEHDKDLEIVLVGDSLTGNLGGSGENPNQAQTPPSLSHFHWSYLLWDRICKNKAVNDRLDSVRDEVDVFTKVGTWVQNSGTDFDVPGDLGEYSVGARTYRSADLNAAVSFVFEGGSYEKLNIVHTLSDNGCNCLIEISEGDGILLVSQDKTNWVEANGYEVNQDSNPSDLSEADSEIAGLAWKQRHRRLWMKKAGTLTTDVNLTFKRNPTDTDTSKYMYCWGTEKWSDYSVFVTNIGRGGRNTIKLGYNISDIFNRKPDLVVYEMPLANEIIGRTIAWLKGDYNEYFITSARSFKTLSSDFTNTDLMVILPHGFSYYWEGDKPVLYYNQEYANESLSYRKSKVMFAYVKSILSAFSDSVCYVNLQDQLINEAKFRGMTIQQSLTGTYPGSFTSDNIHLNALGSRLWTKYLAPIFQ